MKHQIKTKTLAAVSLASTIFFSCSKDNDNDGSKTKAELLTSGSWKMTAYTSNPAEDWNGDGIKETNFLSVMEACEKDDITTFKSNGDVVFDYKTLCSYDSGPQTETEQWSLSSDGKTLTIHYNDTDKTVSEIIELTPSTLKLRETDTYNGVTSTYEFTFSH